jgi:flagellar biosynthesis/type III secretory pathway protein FliH
MGEDPGQIRNDIEETRARMGDTAEALGHKADVPGRTREAISDKVDSVKSTFSGANPQQAVGIAKENPLGLAIGATAVGFIAGLLIPSTRVEDERIGPMADQVKEQAKETGQEAIERGKHVAEQAAQTAKEEGQKQAQEMAPSSS